MGKEENTIAAGRMVAGHLLKASVTKLNNESQHCYKETMVVKNLEYIIFKNWNQDLITFQNIEARVGSLLTHFLLSFSSLNL